MMYPLSPYTYNRYPMGYRASWPLLPVLFAPTNPSSTAGLVWRTGVDDYAAWPNMKKRMAFDTALQSYGDGNSGAGALIEGAVMYTAMTVGEKFIKNYRKFLNTMEERYPAFARFRDDHPVIGNIVAWIPGGISTASATIATLMGGRYLTKFTRHGQRFERMLSKVLPNKVALAIIGVGLLVTSFWYMLAKNGISEWRGQKRDFKTLRKNFRHEHHFKRVPKSELRNQVKTDHLAQYYADRDAEMLARMSPRRRDAFLAQQAAREESINRVATESEKPSNKHNPEDLALAAFR